MTKYVSNFDQWLKKYKQEHLDTESKQREGRSRLWDKPADQIERTYSTVTNRQPGYVYYPVKNYADK